MIDMLAHFAIFTGNILGRGFVPANQKTCIFVLPNTIEIPYKI